MNGAERAENASDLVAQIEHGFKFGRPVVSFGEVPYKLYATLDELDTLDAAAGPYKAVTGADVDDLRYLWRRLGWAKEAGEGSRKSSMTWADGADAVTDAELEAMRETLERHYADRLPTLAGHDQDAEEAATL